MTNGYHPLVMTRLSHDALAALLHGSGIEAGAAETHGIVTGLSCRGLDPEMLDDAVYLVAGRAHRSPEELEHLCDLVSRVHDEVHTSLQGDEFEFGLLLPDDDTAIGERSSAIALWCQGFMIGLLYDGLTVERLPDDTAEAANDILSIAALEDSVDDDESSERALTEIEEYLRVAVQLVYEEILGAPAPELG